VDPKAGAEDVEKRKFLVLPGLKLLPLVEFERFFFSDLEMLNTDKGLYNSTYLYSIT
jgi:hypothetical protein